MIGEAIGRDKSVVWREVNRNASADGVYYASVAHTKAHQARRRPKPLKLIEDEALCRLIGVWMDDGWSPKLDSAMLAFHFADDQTMQVSHETIYQALYVQTRGSLRADLAEKLSLKRKQRVPPHRGPAEEQPLQGGVQDLRTPDRGRRTGHCRGTGKATSSSACDGDRDRHSRGTLYPVHDPARTCAGDHTAADRRCRDDSRR